MKSATIKIICSKCGKELDRDNIRLGYCSHCRRPITFRSK